jgi:hypothetical protein
MGGRSSQQKRCDGEETAERFAENRHAKRDPLSAGYLLTEPYNLYKRTKRENRKQIR